MFRRMILPQHQIAFGNIAIRAVCTQSISAKIVQNICFTSNNLMHIPSSDFIITVYQHYKLMEIYITLNLFQSICFNPEISFVAKFVKLFYDLVPILTGFIIQIISLQYFWILKNLLYVVNSVLE